MVLLGRILIVVGIRKGLAYSGRPNAVVDLAVAAIAVGVLVETTASGVVAAAAEVTARGGSAETVRALDVLANTLDLLLVGPTPALPS